MSQSALTDSISALLASGTPHWGANSTVLNGSSVGGAVTVTYGFLSSSRQVSSSDAVGFAAMNSAQQAAVRRALAAATEDVAAARRTAAAAPSSSTAQAFWVRFRALASTCPRAPRMAAFADHDPRTNPAGLA